MSQQIVTKKKKKSRKIKEKEKRKKKECLSGCLMRGSVVYSLWCRSIPAHLSPGSHLPARTSCPQQTCDTDAEERRPAELAGGPLITPHSHGFDH